MTTLSLRTKAGVAVAVFVAVGTSAAGIIGSRQMSETMHLAALNQGSAILDALAIPAAVAIATHDFAKLDNFVAELERAQPGQVLVLVVVDHEGRLLATTRTGFVGERTRDFDESFIARALAAEDVWYGFGPDRGDPKYVDIGKPIYQGQRWGTILARFSTASLNDALDRLALWTVSVTLLAAIAGWLIAYLVLSRWVLTPSDQIAKMARELEQLATTDGLTGLRNHRFFQSTLDFEIKRGARRIHQMSLCMIDIDFFKKLNDTHGHPAGDEVLKQVGKLLVDNLRSTDVVARYGGEEFAVILLDTGIDEGFRTAQKICGLFRATPFPGEEALPNGKLTVSVGVSSYPEDAKSPAMLVRTADLALYEAKRRGRNTVVRYALEIPQHTGVTEDAKPEDLP